MEKKSKIKTPAPKMKNEKSEQEKKEEKLKKDDTIIKPVKKPEPPVKMMIVKVEEPQPNNNSTMVLDQPGIQSPSYNPVPPMQQELEILQYGSTLTTPVVPTNNTLYSMPLDVFRPTQPQMPQNLTMTSGYGDQISELVQYSNTPAFPDHISLQQHHHQHHHHLHDHHQQQHIIGGGYQVAEPPQPQTVNEQQVPPSHIQIQTPSSMVTAIQQQQQQPSRQPNKSKTSSTNKPRIKKPKSVECDLCESKFYDRYALKRHMMKEHDETFGETLSISKCYYFIVCLLFYF